MGPSYLRPKICAKKRAEAPVTRSRWYHSMLLPYSPHRELATAHVYDSLDLYAFPACLLAMGILARMIEMGRCINHNPIVVFSTPIE